MAVNSILIIALVISIISDIKLRKIYNKVILPSLIIIFILHFVSGGLSELVFSLKGFGVGFLILLIPYLFGGIGAGDVKLLALVGAAKGVVFVAYAAVYMALVGLIMVIFVLWRKHQLYTTMKTIFYWGFARKYGMRLDADFEKNGISQAVPYGLAIGVGTFFVLFFEGRLVL